MRTSFLPAIAAAAFALTPTLASANHDPGQHIGQAIGTVLGTFTTGSGSFTGTQVADALHTYVFFGTAGHAISADTFGSNYDTGLGLLYKGASPIVGTDVIGTNLSILASNDDANNTLQSQINYTLANTGWYALTVGGFGGSTGTYVLNLEGATAIGGIPEPATWAMLILGFGVIGGAVRRRQRVTTRVSFG